MVRSVLELHWVPRPSDCIEDDGEEVGGCGAFYQRGFFR